MQNFDFRNLICSNFKNNGNKVSDKVEYCTNITNVLASGLLRTAATRIFSDPKMSFMEIIANSIDAYSENNTIGKFGMGFISNLYWLFNYPNRYIEIFSNTENETWKAKIYFEDSYKLKFKKMENIKADPFTIIKFCFPDLIGDNETYYSFLKSISKFLNIDINISAVEYNEKGIPEIIFDNGATSDKNIKIYINPTEKKYDGIKPGEMIFGDSASGITSEILFNSMLVPSSSTKKMINIPLKYSEEIKRIDLNDIGYTPYSDFYITVDYPYGITVGNVVIVPLNFTYYIDFPYNTRLTVARDDIIISTNDEKKILKYKIDKIINLSLERGDTKEVISALEFYKNFTDQIIIKKIIYSCINNLLTSDNVILVPKMYDIYNLIEDKYTIEFKNSSVIQISYELYELFKNKINNKLGSKNVVFVKNLEENYTFAGTNNMLFIKTEFYKNDPENCFENIIMSNTKEYIKNNIINDNNYDFIISNYASKFNKHNKEILNIYSSAYKFISNYNLEWENKKSYGVVNSIKYFIETLTKKLEIIVKLNVKKESISDYLSKLFNFFTVSFPKKIIYGQEPTLYVIDHILNQYSDNLVYDSIILKNSKEIQEDILNFEIEIDYYLYEDCVFFVDNKLFDIIKYFSRYANKLYSKLDFIELALFSIIIMQYEYEKVIKTNFTEDELVIIINKMREICDINEMKILLLSISSEGYSENYYTGMYTPISIVIKNLLETNKIEKYTPKITFPKSTTFYLSSLIDYVTKNNVNTNDFDWIEKISKKEIKINSNIIDIACNTGTTKDIIPAILTELIQNSRDAIKKSNSNSKIYIDFYDYDPINCDECVNKCANDILILSVRDEIGIPSSAFTALLIPFLSNKKVEGNFIPVGSMGTGFFNVFRQPLCEKVHIITTPPKTKKTYVIECLPIIKNNKIVNIQYTVSISKKTIKGTSINIFCKGDIKTDVGTFLSNFAGTIDVPIIHNGKQILNEKKITYDGNGYQIRIYGNGYCSSNIQVNGIPVIELTKYDFKEKEYIEKINNLNYNIVIDLNSDVKILPNQSRNKLIITDEEDKYFLFKAILDANYLHLLHKKLGPFGINKIFYGYLSNSNIDQLLPSKSPNLFSNYYFGDRNYSMVTIIHKVYKNFLKVGSKKKAFDIIDNYELFDKERKIIFYWLNSKDFGKTKLNNKIEKVKFESEGLTYFVNKFWSIGYELQLNGIFSGENFNFNDTPPKIFVKTMNDDLNGYYKPSIHTIFLNIKNNPNLRDDMKKLFSMTNSEERINFIYNDLKYLFKVSNVATTLVHELSHAWKNLDSGIHDSCFLTINGNTEEYEFDAAASVVYNHIIQNGLFNF